MNREEKLLVSLYVRNQTGPATWHPRSIQTTYFSTGNHVSSSGASDFTSKEESYFWLDGMDVIPESSIKGAISCIGKFHRQHLPEYDAEKIIERMKQIIIPTQDQRLKIYGGTLTPFKG